MSVLSPDERERIEKLAARRDSLLVRGMDPSEDLIALPGFEAAMLDDSVSVAELLDAFERHVAALEARHPLTN